jgi:pyruvate carboxylase
MHRLLSTLKDPPFRKIMAANRGEIATRIMRAGTELGIETVGIFSHEDRFTQHRQAPDGERSTACAVE